MDIRAHILSSAKKNRKVTVAEVAASTGFSRAYIHRFFKDLVDQGLLAAFGKANQAHYVPADAATKLRAKELVWDFRRVLVNRDQREDQVLDVIKRETGIFDDLAENIRSILEYGFTEMLNNAIEHSSSEKIKIILRRTMSGIRCEIRDWGIGIFENLIHTRHLASTEEAIQDLLKGKQTTKSEAHTGEGIFFTRRAMDTFVIQSSNKKLSFFTLEDDMMVVTTKVLLGTRIVFTLMADASRTLRDVFANYTSEGFEFSKTEVLVHLYRPGGSRDFISRAQARRIVVGLEKFETVILDFKTVATVGQGFADEIFRVWQSHHPNIEIRCVNTNEDIEFMIRHAKART